MSQNSPKAEDEFSLVLGVARRWAEGSCAYRLKKYRGAFYVELHITKLGKPDRFATIPAGEIDDAITFLQKARDTIAAEKAGKP